MDDPADEIPGLYERHAAAWAHARGQTPFSERPWIEKFAAHIPAGGAVLDIGCGAGEPIASYFSTAGFKVTGVDAAASLIELCRERMPNQNWIVGDMRELSLGARFNGLIAWHSFFHLTPSDQRRMFPIFRSHCLPGGVLMFTSGDREGEAIGSFENEPLYHGSLDPAEYRSLLEAAGFDVLDNVLNDPQDGATCVWLAARR